MFHHHQRLHNLTDELELTLIRRAMNEQLRPRPLRAIAYWIKGLFA